MKLLLVILIFPHFELFVQARMFLNLLNRWLNILQK
ncbi:hypothetical protein Mgra_00008302 [Meloidogyne graminicola]|uniref:Uncharacterized protein n=1 Tax=Meloidogyne graminicola TaxID=189291 RepID=A0A8S9ZG46_9BILA|nr:hypothetical protein Mgra_00008302 [Meloidogyne graminicola]